MHVLNTLWVVLGISLMLVLDLRFKINSMAALLLAALPVGMLARMGLMELLHTMESGFDSTLGELAIIVVFGVAIDKLMVDSGAAHRIAHTLLTRPGLRYVQLSVIVIGLIFDLAVFYEVASVMLAPLVIVIAAEVKIPFLRLAIPAVAAVATAHSLFPPQPSPVALVNTYGTDMGVVYIYGILMAIPNVIRAGLILPKLLGSLNRPAPSFMKADVLIDQNSLSSLGISILVPLIPTIITISITITNIWLMKETQAWEVTNFLDSSSIAMFIAMVIAFVLFGTARGHNIQWVMNAFEDTVKNIVMVILIIGAGGVLKQTIIDTGIGDTIDMLMSHGNISSYIITQLTIVLIRLATSQGVISAMTAAGIISVATLDPAAGQLTGVDPASLVLVTAAGSNTLTHINDASFWLFRGYFDLSMKSTLKTQSLLELVNSVVGLIIMLIISMIA